MSPFDLQLRLEQMQSFNDNLLGAKTPLETKIPQRRNWFRHFTIEDTNPDPPFEAQSYTIGQMESKLVPKILPKKTLASEIKDSILSAAMSKRRDNDTKGDTYASAPWQRLM